MKLVSHNRLFQAAVVAAGIVALCSSDALAWGHKRASYGSYGSSGSAGSYASYGSYGSSGSSASYGSYGSYGSSGSSAAYGSSSGSSGRVGLIARWHARKAAKHSSGSYGSSGSSGGSYYAYSASSGSSGSYGGYGSSGSSGSYSAPMYYESAPADAVPTEPQPAPPEATSAAIRVSVPAHATVFVNDRPTTSTGSERNYVSRGLAGGRTYAYKLRVEFERDGEKVVENKLVRLQAGETIDLTFGSGEQMAAEQAEPTNLTVHVPAEAKVTLAGAATQQAGETRTYATSALALGQEWDGYVVRVELERNGETLVEEKTLTIVGGQSYELSFDFAEEATTVASLN
jgi:uncharacterized protein (TIGR03000 family)